MKSNKNSFVYLKLKAIFHTALHNKYETPSSTSKAKSTELTTTNRVGSFQ